MSTAPTAKIILDSISEFGDRLTTMEVTCHRFVLAEFNTHRVFSRNSASSRARPIEKTLEQVIFDPADPLEWACEQPGMQGGAELSGSSKDDAIFLWDQCRADIINNIQDYLLEHPDKGDRLHKSLINRLIEPFMWHTIIVSSTEWENFFGLRCSPLAQPEIRVAAEAMREAYEQSTPKEIEYGDWHMPYIDPDEYDRQSGIDGIDPRAISAARCARVSYLTHDGVRDPEKDFELYKRLISANPAHASPLEHVATPSAVANDRPLGNFQGWRQLRHFVNS